MHDKDKKLKRKSTGERMIIWKNKTTQILICCICTVAVCTKQSPIYTIIQSTVVGYFKGTKSCINDTFIQWTYKPLQRDAFQQMPASIMVLI